MHPYYIEILCTLDDLYGWSVTFENPELDREGTVPTFDAAMTAVQAAVDAGRAA